MTLSPGAYLKHRRTAAGLSVRDVAAALATEPRVAEHARADWIEMVEADIAPATFNTIVALRRAFQFDLVVLAQLAAVHLGADIATARLCRICACSELDACLSPSGLPCHWVDVDLCSACAGAIAIAAAA